MSTRDDKKPFPSEEEFNEDKRRRWEQLRIQEMERGLKPPLSAWAVNLGKTLDRVVKVFTVIWYVIIAALVFGLLAIYAFLLIGVVVGFCVQAASWNPDPTWVGWGVKLFFVFATLSIPVWVVHAFLNRGETKESIIEDEYQDFNREM